MTRKPIPESTQATVLLRVRRRCCICYGLNRDTAIKQGQVSHLDGDPANNNEANLAFLCLDHHDQYDSITRQSKGFTVEEVRRFRSELSQVIAVAFDAEAAINTAETPATDDISGHYIRGVGFESAELRVSRMADSRYHVWGLALWGQARESGPNLGELDFVGELHGDTIEYTWTQQDGEIYRARLRFSAQGLTISEDNWLGMFGMNVQFSGHYARAA